MWSIDESMGKALAVRRGGAECEGQNLEEWRTEEMGGGALPRLKEWELEKVSRMYKAKTRVGCDGFPPQGSPGLDLIKETRGAIVELLEKLEQSGKWPQQACTTMFILISKNVTS